MTNSTENGNLLAYLQSLVENEVRESKTIEYKEQLNIGTDKEKKEFLADVSSFANASGGDLIIGIEEDREKGIPKRLLGMEIDKVDSLKLKIEEIIRMGIEPRLPAVQVLPVTLPDNHVALIIRIGKSWINPHRVIFKGHDKFYTRNSSGKYPMDASELRTAFTLSDTIYEKIRKFREARLGNIIAGETPVLLLEAEAKAVLHLVPLSSMSPGTSYDISQIAADPYKMPPIYYHKSFSDSLRFRYNFNGYVTFLEGLGSYASYTQIYKNGQLEAADSFLNNESDENVFFEYFEDFIIQAFSRYIELYKNLQIYTPIVIFLTLINIKGYRLNVNSFNVRMGNIHKIDRDVLIIPEVVMESYDQEPAKVLKPIFDSIWNACGLPGSINYDKDGNWSSRKSI